MKVKYHNLSRWINQVEHQISADENSGKVWASKLFSSIFSCVFFRLKKNITTEKGASWEDVSRILQGSWNGTYFGINQSKCMEILRDFPYQWCIIWIGKVVTPVMPGKYTGSILKLMKLSTLPKTSSRLLKWAVSQKKRIVFQPLIFRCCLSFTESMLAMLVVFFLHIHSTAISFSLWKQSGKISILTDVFMLKHV